MIGDLISFDSSWLVIGALVVFVFFAFPYVAAPFIVGMTLRFRLPAQVIRVDPQQTPLPEDVRLYFDQAYHVLTANGFVLLDVMFLPTIVPNVRSLLAVYVNRRTCDAAMSVFMLAEGPMSTVRKRHVEFIRRFSDGTLVQTNNSDELGAFPPKPREHTTQFAQLADVGRLYAIHCFLARKLGGMSTPVLRIDAEYQGNALEYVARVAIDESLTAQIKTGYLMGSPQELRPTLRGAVIMAWQELWPAKAIRRARRRRAAEAASREFDASAAGGGGDARGP